MTMNTFRTLTAALAVALTVASAPAFAQGRVHQAGYAARAQATQSVVSQDGVPLDRAQALRACNELAAPFKNSSWGHGQDDIYRSCMARHGQAE
jgi:hypothetical protein